MKTIARLSFLLITVLWGSFYAVAKEALTRIDPVIFTFFEVIALVPIAIALLIIYRENLNREIVKRGIILGSWICIAMLTVTTSERFTDATNTAFFPAIGGVTGAFISGVALKQKLSRSVWIAGAFSLAGTLIIVLASSNGLEMRGDFIAFLGALFFTGYVFLVDHDRQKHNETHGESVFWCVMGIEHITMAIWMTFIALLFGDWQHAHPVFPKDAEIIIYISVATTFVPVVLSMFMQKFIEPLEAAFITILEPIWGVIIAHFYLGETLPTYVYLGGILVIIGSLFHTWSTSGVSSVKMETGSLLPALPKSLARKRVRAIGFPMLFLVGGILFLEWLGGFPPTSWLQMYHMWSHFPTMIGQGQGGFVFALFAQCFCWAIAWITLALIVIILATTSAQNMPVFNQRKRIPKTVATRLYVTEVVNYVPEKRLTATKLSTNHSGTYHIQKVSSAKKAANVRRRHISSSQSRLAQQKK